MFTHEKHEKHGNNFTEQRILTKEEFKEKLLKAYEELNAKLKETDQKNQNKRKNQNNERNQNENLCNSSFEV